MNRSLKALSLLLTYPTIEIQSVIPEISAALNEEQRISAASRGAFGSLFDHFTNSDIYYLEELYVRLFDRSRSLSLNLFEHVHGESRDRGGAMVSLLETYRDAGFEPATSELPDYLPVVLEYLAVREDSEQRAVLADAAHILEALRLRHEEQKSPFTVVFSALVDLSNAQINENALANIMAVEHDSPDDLIALDEVWQESEVTFGSEADTTCPKIPKASPERIYPLRRSSSQSSTPGTRE